MSHRVKYPRTPHLPWSTGRTRDDLALESLDSLENSAEVVVTEKMDGENTTMYRDAIHARSLDSRSHPSRSRVKALHASIRHALPRGLRICGENVLAVHSIFYRELPSYFLVFAVFDGDTCLSWDDTVALSSRLGLARVPVLYRGPWAESAIRACWTGTSRCGGDQEGYVVRPAAAFASSMFARCVAKYVRPGHVTDDAHWWSRPVVENQLASSPPRTE